MGPEQQKVQQQVQAAVQPALLLESYDLADPSGLKMLTVDRDAVCILWQIPVGELHTAQGFGLSAIISTTQARNPQTLPVYQGGRGRGGGTSKFYIDL